MGLRGVQRPLNGIRERELGRARQAGDLGSWEAGNGGRVEVELGEGDEKAAAATAVALWETL